MFSRRSAETGILSNLVKIVVLVQFQSKGKETHKAFLTNEIEQTLGVGFDITEKYASFKCNL